MTSELVFNFLRIIALGVSIRVGIMRVLHHVTDRRLHCLVGIHSYLIEDSLNARMRPSVVRTPSTVRINNNSPSIFGELPENLAH